MSLVFSHSQGGNTCTASDNARNTWSCVVVHGRAWSLVRGLSWSCVVVHGCAWSFMVVHVRSWSCVVVRGLSW